MRAAPPIILILAPAGILIATAVLSLVGLGVYSRRRGPRAAGSHGGRLAPCPGSPNCVASTAGRGEAGGEDRPAGGAPPLAPLEYSGTPSEARRRLLAVLGGMPGTTVVVDDGAYMRVEVRSRLFGFVDDVEFLFDDAAGRIDFRSASRVGYSDFGANRARMVEIARRFAAAGPPAGGPARRPG